MVPNEKNVISLLLIAYKKIISSIKRWTIDIHLIDKFTLQLAAGYLKVKSMFHIEKAMVSQTLPLEATLMQATGNINLSLYHINAFGSIS